MEDAENMEGEETIARMKEREEEQRRADAEETARAQKMLQEQKEAKIREIEELKAKKEARRIEREKQMEIIKKHEQERRARQQEEARQRKEEAERKKKEREASRRAMINPLAFKGTGMAKFDEDRKFLLKDDADFAEERLEAIEKRVPPLNLNINEADLRKLAEDMIKRLKRKYGIIFDMGRTLKKRDYVFNELNTRIRAREEDAYKERKARAGGVSKYSSEGNFQPLQNFTPDQRRESIMSSGGVMGRMAMFGGGGGHKPDTIQEEPPRVIDLTK